MDLACSSFFIPDGLEHGNLVVKLFSLNRVLGVSVSPGWPVPFFLWSSLEGRPRSDMAAAGFNMDTQMDLSCSSFFISDGLEHGNLVEVTEVQSDQKAFTIESHRRFCSVCVQSVGGLRRQ
ncbi:uncharacterized protein ACNS7B_004563 [Menidia menidia]